MRENRIRQLWAQGQAALTAWLSVPSSYSAEAMAQQGFDCVTVDTQHGMIDVQAAMAMFQAISTTSATPLARSGWNDPMVIMKLLDSGAYGIICPMVNSGAECEAFVRACRYPPAGNRSFAVTRGQLYGGSDYAEHANDTIVTLAMIETRQALDNLDDIVRVEGLDAVYIGPNDLALALGYGPSAEPSEKEVIEAVDTILAIGTKHGVKVGIHCPTGESARRRVGQGFAFIAIANDLRMLSAAAKAEVVAAKGE